VGCAALADGGVECGSGLSREDVAPRIEIRLGDRDDHATSEVEGPAQEIDMAGGPGSDTLHSGSGTGNTHLLSGGPGNDHLITQTNNVGDATLIGGPGDDVLENLEGGRASFYGRARRRRRGGGLSRRHTDHQRRPGRGSVFRRLL